MSLFYETQNDYLVITHNFKQVKFPQHAHESIEILYVFKGIQQIRLNQKLYTVSSGNAIIIFPDVIHEFDRDSNIPKCNNAAESVCIELDSKIFYGLFPNLRDKTVKMPLITMLPENVCELLDKLKYEKSMISALGMAYIVIDKLFDKIEISDRLSDSNTDTVKKINNYMYLHLDEALTLENVSAALNISQAHLSYIFSNKIKVNFRLYLGMLRVKQASMLIRTTDYSFTRISTGVGFNSQRTFNRLFKETYGMTPSEYRQKNKPKIYK